MLAHSANNQPDNQPTDHPTSTGRVLLRAAEWLTGTGVDPVDVGRGSGRGGVAGADTLPSGAARPSPPRPHFSSPTFAQVKGSRQVIQGNILHNTSVL